MFGVQTAKPGCSIPRSETCLVLSRVFLAENECELLFGDWEQVTKEGVQGEGDS